MPRPRLELRAPRLCFALTSPLLALMQPTLAQTAPDAGSLLRQNQRPEPLPRAEPAKPLVEQQARPAPGGAGVSVSVKAFALEGNATLATEALQARLQPWLGRTVDLNGLREAATTVCAAYAEAGWLAYCDLPAQDVTEGRIRIRVLEARYGGLKVEGDPKRLKPGIAAAMIESRFEPGEKLSLVKLERAILLVSALPGINASGSLSAGAAEGDTLVNLALADAPLFGGDLSLDNGGQRSTGSTRASALLHWDGPLRLGDSISAQLMHTRGNDYLRLAASLPVGLAGWRIGANASGLHYKLVEGEMADLDGKGSASSAGLEASYPLIRSGSANLQLQLAADSKRFDNQANGATTSRYRTHSFTTGLYGSLLDAYQGSSSGSLAASLGHVDLGGSPSESADAQGPQTAGSYHKINYSLGRQQGFNPWLSGSASLSGQVASKNLDTSERFYLGGPGGVRAYPSSEGGGSSGQMLKLELRAALPAQASLSGFFDWGHVTTLVNGAAIDPGPNAYSLKGAGASLGWTGPAGLNLRLTLARRIGSNPNPSHTGSDQDGTLKRNRVWLQASLPI